MRALRKGEGAKRDNKHKYKLAAEGGAEDRHQSLSARVVQEWGTTSRSPNLPALGTRAKFS